MTLPLSSDLYPESFCSELCQCLLHFRLQDQVTKFSESGSSDYSSDDVEALNNELLARPIKKS